MAQTRKLDDEWLFGWDDTPGIVSVWADRSGRALVWRRQDDKISCAPETYRPWLFARSLDDVRHLGDALKAESDPKASAALVTYRELGQAQESSYRFVISARNGQLLERAILHGASKRLNQNVANFNDIKRGYYRVGPVEQYMMQTGRVYFRGLQYTDLHRLQFDLETTSLSPHDGRIFLVAVRDNKGLKAIIEAPTEGDEAALIERLCALICERDPDIIENHNLFGFDLPFLYERAKTLRVPLQLGRAEGPMTLEQYKEAGETRRRRRNHFSLAGRELIDTLEAVWRHDFVARTLPSHGLKAVARFFGVAAPDRTYLEGKDVYPTYKRDPAIVRRYALDDVTEVDALSQQLLGAPFALAGMAPRRYERLASAGPAMGILEPMLVRAYLRSGVALPLQAPDSDSVYGPHSGGATILYAAGVAQHVVKADIASMYPSIMRVFRIGPSCDQLQVLLTLVDRLTDLRLSHKAAAKTATPGSYEAQQHDAIQAAMKLLINSAYGYMGAGAMALFADRHAADEVTSRGRDILAQVVDLLQQRGMSLLEADTDGVFFAAPLAWNENQERQLVAEVGAALPPGIRLEYEGRYQAMLSHEVKNYVLLAYEGKLIVRGVAFRSTRAEIFGVRFLLQAIRHLLQGDVMQLQKVYQETIADLRDLRVAPADLASRTRLSKNPAEYFSSRARLRQAQYEALITAGRNTTWEPGEWVRFYKRRDGQFIWLPDDSATPADESALGAGAAEAGAQDTTHSAAHNVRGDYDVAHYIRLLHVSFVSRLHKAFRPQDFEQIFRPDGQTGLFDEPVSCIQPLWIRANG